MDKKLLWVVTILLITVLVLQCVLIKKVDKVYEGLGSVGEYLSEKIDKTMGEVYEIQDILEEIKNSEDRGEG
ncbi:hypothetical protein [Pseudoflavonifractor sp. An184]|uniref:hypothetical protein n=1 Tax=Pseudoflavonifractor sp. An184 TaxID=1965576 RepID=UPI000B3A9C1F|nr:hypothetical protein [Pseudoflavonifractor sp. An184]OUP56924.1 hypothetical protein B5F19_05285 [Pseudoflavonifractor sp. An184]